MRSSKSATVHVATEVTALEQWFIDHSKLENQVERAVLNLKQGLQRKLHPQSAIDQMLLEFYNFWEDYAHTRNKVFHEARRLLSEQGYHMGPKDPWSQALRVRVYGDASAR